MSGQESGLSGERARTFVCDVEPRGDGRWNVWLSEKPYRGVDTDAVMGHFGERQRVGGTYTSRWLVGTYGTLCADVVARRVVRRVSRIAAREDAANEAWRANAQRAAKRLTSPGVEGRSDPTGGDGYVPGAWDEVRSAYLDGHISAAAYDALRALVIPPGKRADA